jgi:hypothetical protein
MKGCPCELVLWCVEGNFRDVSLFRHYDDAGRMYYYARPRRAPEQQLLANYDCPFLRSRLPGKRKKLKRRRGRR